MSKIKTKHGFYAVAVSTQIIGVTVFHYVTRSFCLLDSKQQLEEGNRVNQALTIYHELACQLECLNQSFQSGKCIPFLIYFFAQYFVDAPLAEIPALALLQNDAMSLAHRSLARAARFSLQHLLRVTN